MDDLTKIFDVKAICDGHKVCGKYHLFRQIVFFVKFSFDKLSENFLHRCYPQKIIINIYLNLRSKAREMLEEIIDNHKRELEKDKNAHSKNIEVITKIFEKTLNEATKIKEECSAAEIAENIQSKYKKMVFIFC